MLTAKFIPKKEKNALGLNVKIDNFKYEKLIR